MVVVLLALTLACAADADPKAFLWIPPEATILRAATSYERGNADVGFTIPLSDLSQRDTFTAGLSQRLEKSGWRRRSREYMNPHRITSFGEGWKRGGGGMRLPDGAPKRRSFETYKWRGEWEDADGNVIQYSLFAYYLPAPQGAEIRIYNAYVPAKLVMAGP